MAPYFFSSRWLHAARRQSPFLTNEDSPRWRHPWDSQTFWPIRPSFSRPFVVMVARHGIFRENLFQTSFLFSLSSCPRRCSVRSRRRFDILATSLGREKENLFWFESPSSSQFSLDSFFHFLPHTYFGFPPCVSPRNEVGKELVYRAEAEMKN